MKEFQALGLDLKIINDAGEAMDLKTIEEEEDREDNTSDEIFEDLPPITEDGDEEDETNDDWDAEDEFEDSSLDDIDDADIDFDEGGEF